MLKAEDELAALERALAYSAARSDIECYCAAADADFGGRWYDTTQVLDDDDETVETALRYLELRGLIERHPSQPWVRVRDDQ